MFLYYVPTRKLRLFSIFQIFKQFEETMYFLTVATERLFYQNRNSLTDMLNLLGFLTSVCTKKI